MRGALPAALAMFLLVFALVFLPLATSAIGHTLAVRQLLSEDLSK